MTKEKNQPLHHIEMMPQSGKKEILRYNKVSKTDEQILIRLYKAMTDDDFEQEIDIRMLAEEAIPHFTEIIGKKNMQKILEFFARDYQSSKSKRNNNKIYALIRKLTTIDNAMYYISGYKEFIHKTANLLNYAPDDMPEIVKAKIVCAYMVIMHNNHFFEEDYFEIQSSNCKTYYQIEEEKVFQNNSQMYRPERLMMLFNSKFSQLKPGSLFYPLIKARIDDMGDSEKEDFYKFAELSCENGIIKNLNEPYFQTFGEIRELKMRVNAITAKYPAITFISEFPNGQLDLLQMYQMYRELTITDDWSSFSTINEHEEVISEDGDSIDIRNKSVFKIGNEVLGSKEEMLMLKRYFEFLVKKDLDEKRIGFEIKLISRRPFSDNNEEDEEENEEYISCRIYLGLFMAAQKYFQEIGYYDPKRVSLIDELELAQILFINFDCEELLRKFEANEIDVIQFRNELGIDKKADKEIFGFVRAIDAFDQFMSEERLNLTSEELKLAKEIIFEKYQNLFRGYAQNMIDRKFVRENCLFDLRFFKGSVLLMRKRS